MRCSGNVFADFGDADAETNKMKADIAVEIILTLNKRGLTARAGAKVAKVDANIQRIRNADFVPIHHRPPCADCLPPWPLG